MSGELSAQDARTLFRLYMQVTDVPRLEPRSEGDPRLRGRKVGIINGSSWISLWSSYFGRLILPEVQLVNVGNEAVQLNFMRAHHEGRPTPPAVNIEAFSRYARDLTELVGMDVILISCSTMNRSYGPVQEAVARYGVPVVPIDQPMMEKAATRGGRVLLVATHGPTVESTRKLLQETAERLGTQVESAGATVEEAFDLLGQGRIEEHNEAIAAAIRDALSRQSIETVVLAQLSMTVFKLSYPNPQETFGVEVLTSGEEGFRRVREILLGQQ